MPMVRRTVSLLLYSGFILCLCAFAWSQGHRERIGFAGDRLWLAELGDGALTLARSDYPETPHAGWHYAHLGPDPYADELDTAGGVRLLGFHVHPASAPPANWGFASVRLPLWMIGLPLLVLIIWRERSRLSSHRRAIASGFEPVQQER